MDSKAAVQMGLAVAMSGYLPSLKDGHMIAVACMVAILLSSSIVLFLRDALSNRVWKALVAVASNIDIVYSAFGFGFMGAGIAFLPTGWWPVGFILLLIGSVVNLIGILRNVGRIRLQNRA